MVGGEEVGIEVSGLRVCIGRTDFAIHFQPSWPTASECFSYPCAVSKFIQLRHRPRESVTDPVALNVFKQTFKRQTVTQ